MYLTRENVRMNVQSFVTSFSNIAAFYRMQNEIFQQGTDLNEERCFSGYDYF